MESRNPQDPTVVIVGAYGSAGTAVAEGLVDEDVSIVLVDDGDPGGGLCILRGCMPSKEVLSAGAHRYQARVDHRLEGVPEVELDEVVETKDEHIHGFAEHRRSSVHEMAERENVEFVHDTARLVDDDVVEVGDGRRIEADYVVIATGSTVNVPSIDGIEDVEYTTSDDVLGSTEFGDTGVVMGFGTVGLEMVPYLSEAAGVDLTVIEHDAAPLDIADDELGERILDIYREEFGVEVLTHTYEESLEATDDGVVLHTDRDDKHATVEADELFLFTGRRPSLPDGIENTSLEPREGWVDATMRSVDTEGVYVVGDANGREPILHVAKEQGYKAAENLLAEERGEESEEYEHLRHRVTFTALGVYPFALLGLTEREAEERGIDHVAVTREASDDGVFKTKDAPRGLAKLVVAEDGEVLGYQGLHYHADVMAKTMQVVLENGMDVDEVPDRAYHPTTPEIIDGLLGEAKSRLG